MRFLIFITRPIHPLWNKLIQRVYLWALEYASKHKHDKKIGENYLLRWHIIRRNKLFNIYLHRVTGDDIDRALHDHPYFNMSIILFGSYLEVNNHSNKIRKNGHVILRRAKPGHRLKVNGQPPVWSLFITGPRIREWGFLCKTGWVPWFDFVDPNDPGQIGRGCGED